MREICKKIPLANLFNLITYSCYSFPIFILIYVFIFFVFIFYHLLYAFALQTCDFFCWILYNWQ